MRICAFPLAAWLIATPLAAETVVGKAIVDGRTVDLLSDQTWQFSDTASASGDCKVLTTALSFCGDTFTWQPTTPGTPDAVAAYRHDDRHFAQFIIEEIGTAQGLSQEAVRSIILDFAKQISGADPVVIGVEPVSIGGLSGETVIYAFKVNGLATVYANSIVMGDNLTLQAMTYQIGTEYTDKQRDLHVKLLAATKVTE